MHRSLALLLVAIAPAAAAAQDDSVARRVDRRADRRATADVRRDVRERATVARTVNLARDRERLRAADEAASVGKSVVDALDARFTDDVVLLVGGEPVLRGRAAARSALAKQDANVRGTTRSRPIRLDVADDGSLGYSFGYTETEVATDSGPRTLVGKYLALWRKQADGSWRIAAYVRNPRRPGEAPAAPPPGFESPRGEPAAGATRSVDAAAEREAVMATDRAFSDSGARDLGEAFARFAAPDGAVLGPAPEMTWGRDAIRADFSGGPPARRLVWGPVLGGVSSTGDLGWTIGEAETRAMDQPGTPAVGKSKYLTIWRKQPDGTWRYVVDGGNGRP